MNFQSHPLDESIKRIGVVRSYARGSEIMSEEIAADRVCEVISGTVCTCRMLKEGRRQIAGFYFAGDVFGFEPAEKQALAVQAITDAKLRVIKKQALNKLASCDVRVSDRLLSLTALELGRKQDLILLLSRSAEERVICFLAEMGQRASLEGNHIVLPMDRTDIADYLGLALETVSRVFWDLERRGAIEISGRHNVVVRNQPADGKVEKLFEGIKGRQPNSETELDGWLASAEGRAATLFDLTSHSRWPDRV
jgi:CRP/FNR family nitrogen fixation transcriptional regulator